MEAMTSPVTTTTTTITTTTNAVNIDNETHNAQTLLSNRVALRQQVLDITANTLKSELFGLDTLIDRLIDSVRAWYLLPEVIDRPVIVCLWGLTGTGKTQLVRRLAQLLGFYDRFLEVQMDGFSNSTRGMTRDSIAAMLASSSIVEGEPGILLLDEFQRFRTRDRKGNDVAVKRYQDVWALLSDGRLSPPMDALDRIELEQAYHQYEAMQARVDKANEESDNDDDAPRKKPKQQSPFHLSAYDARDLQHALKLSEPITQIMRWTPDIVQQRLEQFRNDPSRWGTDHSKLLILVTGNLDEMYQGVAKRVQDCDTDADVFHRFTERLSTIDVKEALSERFRPEQVARLGNQHLVFPSLDRKAYERLIADACSKQVDAVRSALQLDIELTPAVLKTLYQNAVFPVQGTRPVFSTVHAVLGPSLGSAAVWAMQKLAQAGLAHRRSQCRLQLDMSDDGKQLVMRLQRVDETDSIAEQSIALHLEIDKLRERAQPDFRALLAVHEAGHGLVYALLNHCAPTDVRINVASFEGGYASYAPRVAESRRMARDEICVTLAGRAAELWVFGKDAVTTGAEEDLSSATRHAARYHRHWAMGDRLSRTDVTHDVEQHVNTDIDASNAQIEATLQTELARAQQLLQDARAPFEKLVKALLENGCVDAKQFAAVTGLELPAKSDALEPWNAAWQRFAANDLQQVA
ncbi:AAA family ATPase [Diaphorobacter sp. HDW4B]|uniref:AAA family ATPase n=1 Tax=Diaphorobacter sp. HDW4B TaxID=2714925 RepID=UPI001409E81D|nr:AAA family ATPase [Diaphorobacter sp. HDW4B]QIL72416.1 AAA family ATPase [Diaphorobacter sp. HDW4B]